MKIREATHNDLSQLLSLYTQLHGNAMPARTPALHTLWDNILSDKNHHIILCEAEGAIVSSCVMIVVPNLTHNQRPYALIENVITGKAHRRKGYARALLDYAKKMAIQCNCYKMMLLSGSKEKTTLQFYENAGYNQNDKTAFIQWLDN